MKWSTNEDWRPNLVILSCLFLGTALAGHLIHTDGGPWIPEPWPAVAPGLASAVFIPAVNFWVGRAKRPQNTVAILHVLGTALLQLGVLSLANAARGAFFYSLIFLYVFTAAVHAYRLRVTYRRPFVAIPYAAVIAVAAACAPSEAHLVVYAFLAPLLLGHLLLGQYAANADAAHEREMILRAENSALALELERRQVRRLEEFLEEIAGRTHDIGGPALALDIALEHAMSALAGDAAAAREALAHAKRHTADIRERVRRAKEEVRSVSLPAFEPVDVLEVATAVVEGLRLRFADVDIDVRGERASIELRGGRLALARVIENLGSNGAEAAHTSTSPAPLDLVARGGQRDRDRDRRQRSGLRAWCRDDGARHRSRASLRRPHHRHVGRDVGYRSIAAPRRRALPSAAARGGTAGRVARAIGGYEHVTPTASKLCALRRARRTGSCRSYVGLAGCEQRAIALSSFVLRRR
ncbi:MAG: hypothetical protein M5U28_37400 [Sandaracinaceae bacterium]|nr:hypothetical protein [Sandaracinaceae bacterium]